MNEPPYEKNGSGMPVIGIRPMVIPMFTITWVNQAAASPKATSDANGVAARVEMRTVRRKNKRKRPSAILMPMNPSSSPTTGKMKSVCCSGRKARRFCEPSVNPLPNRPPEPTATCDWITWYPDARGSLEGSRNTSSRRCWYGLSRSQSTGATTPIATFAPTRTTPSSTAGRYHPTRASSMRNHAPHTPGPKARMRLTAGLAAMTSSGHGTPLQKSIAKKMPRNTIAVPRSGCAMIRSHGSSTMAAGFQRPSNDVGALRSPESTRASISTTAIFANSDGCPSCTPPIESQLLVLAAVPAPLPKKSRMSNMAQAPMYTGHEAHSSRRTDILLMMYAAPSPSANHTIWLRQRPATYVGTSVWPAEYTMAMPNAVSVSASAISGQSAGIARFRISPPSPAAPPPSPSGSAQ